MVTTLLKVHHDVKQRHRLGASDVELIKIPGQNPLVILPAKTHGYGHG